MARQFQYIAIDASGQRVEGSLESSSKAEALRSIQSQGMRPLSVQEGKRAEAAPVTHESVKLKPKLLISFTEELSELLGAGLPLEPALASMAARDESGELKNASAQLRRHITEGEQMYQALPKVSAQFDQLYCNLVKAGEASGSLQTILCQHALYLKQKLELKSRLTLALIYPASLIFVCVIVALLFLFYLLPQILELLKGLSTAEMPFGVVLMSGARDFLGDYWMVLLIAALAVMVLTKIWHQSEANQTQWDAWQLKVPIAGKIIAYGIYVQWLQTLGNLISNGVPLVQGLTLTAETISNRHFRHGLQRITERVRDGYNMTRCMRESQLFPPNMIDLIQVGENTGKLSRALHRATEYYDTRLNGLIKGMLALISPIVLIVMAVMVAVLLYTMIQAIYGTMSHMSPGG